MDKSTYSAPELAILLGITQRGLQPDAPRGFPVLSHRQSACW